MWHGELVLGCSKGTLLLYAAPGVPLNCPSEMFFTKDPVLCAKRPKIWKDAHVAFNDNVNKHERYGAQSLSKRTDIVPTYKTSLWLIRRFRVGGLLSPSHPFIYHLLLSKLYLLSSISYDSSCVYLRSPVFSILSIFHLQPSTFYLLSSIL